MNRFAIAISVLLFSAWGAQADVIHLSDGAIITGEAKKVGDEWIIRTADGQSTTVGADRVASIEITRGPASAARAGQQLDSLRSSIENLDDLNEIAKRLQNFADVNAN